MTGGAGFIGSNYVRTLLRGGYPAYAGARVTVLDKLTYSGNPANLAPVADDEAYTFVRGDICDADLARPGPARSRRGGPLRRRVARRPLDRGSPPVRHHQRAGHPDAAGRRAAGRNRPLPARVDRRGLRLDHRGLVDRGVAAATQLAVLGLEGRLGPARARVPPHAQHGPRGHPVLQQLRALPVPGEGHPAVRHQPARRQAGAALRRRRSTYATGCTSPTTAPASSWRWRRAGPARSTTSAAAASSPTRS